MRTGTTVTQTETLDQACEALKRSVKTFAVTDVAPAAVIFDGGELVSVPGVPDDAIDTNGVGGIFVGAFCML